VFLSSRFCLSIANERVSFSVEFVQGLTSPSPPQAELKLDCYMTWLTFCSIRCYEDVFNN